MLGAIDTASSEATLHDAYAGIVDHYGQFTRGHWPEKISDDAALHAAHATEQAALAKEPAQQTGLDTYGGRLDVLVFQRRAGSTRKKPTVAGSW